MSARGTAPVELAQVVAALTAAASDPFVAQQIRHMQERAARMLVGLAHDANAVLAAQAGPPYCLPQGAVNVSALAGAARQRQTQGTQQRQLAEDMVLGAFINHGNPQWDPLDPATHRAGGDNLLLALLQVALPEPSAPVLEQSD